MPRTPVFRIYAHRGDAAYHPENTLPAFHSALEKGADALETDVRLTSDGEVVVFHDATGTRMTGQDRAVLACRWEEVRCWRTPDGQPPPLLAELLEAFPDVFVNIDVKDNLPLAAERTLSVVRRAGAAHRVGLGSFHTGVARALRMAGWQGQLALTVPEVAAVRLLPGLVGRLLVRGDAVQIPTHRAGVRLDRRRFVRRCHRLGLRVDYWTIDDPQQAVELVARGADGIVTNDPGAIAQAFRRRWPGSITS